MLPVTAHFDKAAQTLRALLPSLRDEDLHASGIDLDKVLPARRFDWASRHYNCYSYAIDYRNRNIYHPGALYERDHPGKKLADIFNLSAKGPLGFFEFAERVVDGLKRDGLAPLGFEPSFSRPGTLVAAFVGAKDDIDNLWGIDSEGHDMHFYALRRYDESADGIERPQLAWTHKRGDLTPEFCREDATRAGDISDPAAIFANARYHGYNYFAGYYIADKAAMGLKPG